MNDPTECSLCDQPAELLAVVVTCYQVHLETERVGDFVALVLNTNPPLNYHKGTMPTCGGHHHDDLTQCFLDHALDVDPSVMIAVKLTYLPPGTSLEVSSAIGTEIMKRLAAIPVTPQMLIEEKSLIRGIVRSARAALGVAPPTYQEA